MKHALCLCNPAKIRPQGTGSIASCFSVPPSSLSKPDLTDTAFGLTFDATQNPNAKARVSSKLAPSSAQIQQPMLQSPRYDLHSTAMLQYAMSSTQASSLSGPWSSSSSRISPSLASNSGSTTSPTRYSTSQASTAFSAGPSSSRTSATSHSTPHSSPLASNAFGVYESSMRDALCMASMYDLEAASEHLVAASRQLLRNTHDLSERSCNHCAIV